MLIAALGALSAAGLLGVGCGSSGGSSGSASTQSNGGSAASSGSTSTSNGSTSSGAGMGGSSSCSSQFPGVDPTTLQGSGCCTFEPSHCEPLSDIPEGIQNAFDTCSGGLCVPDQVIKAGIFTPTSCTTSVVGLKLTGACLSKCWLQVSGNSMVTLLNAGDCTGTGELCAPCTNPLANNAPTGACSIPALECPAADAGPTDAGGDGGSLCPYTGPPLVDPTTFAECSPSCSGSHCVPSTLVPAAEQSLLSTCTPTGGGSGFCAPDTLIESGGNGLPPTCTSIAGAEGRCLSTCIPQVASLAEGLPQDVCASGQLCAPCFNPTADDPMAPTGACTTACDMPKDAPTIISCPYTGPNLLDPTKFPACDNGGCSGAHCIPSALIPTSLQSQLSPCGGGTGFCAPDVDTESGGKTVPPSCTSVAGVEGRCLSECLPLVASEASILPDSTCGSNEKCVPCYNPTAADPSTPTGACTTACDMPKDPATILSCPYSGTPPVLDPTTLPACDNGGCGGAHCLPAVAVPTALQSQLTACNNNTGFCTPDLFIETGNLFVPTSCDPFGTAANPSGAQGRCLSECLPMIAAEGKSALIVQSTCGSNELCAPCFDPFTGASTGACSLGCDMPPAKTFTLPTCCADGTGKLTGTCVPTELIPSSQQSEVNQSGNGNTVGCPSSIYSCVPDTYLPAPYNAAYPLQKCTSTSLVGLGNTCGVCVSECTTSNLGVFNQDGCAAESKCVDCAAAAGLGMTVPGCSTLCP